ncbi:MAG TPA: TerC family protein [Bacteroidales bacterium]|nr:TerC family protein [Bacteroidales bacterium]
MISINYIAWLGFITFILIMLIIDLTVFHKELHAVKLKEAIIWTITWIILALLFNIGIYLWVDKIKAIEFFTAYLIEKSLSVDNLFVFLMLFSYFNINPKYQHEILFWGIIGAIIMRAIFIFAGIALINSFNWIIYVFGLFLIYTGFKMYFKKEQTPHPEKNPIIKLLKKIFPVTEDIANGKFFIKKNKKLFITPLFITLIVIEFSDLIFAVDSIPAVLAISKDPFIVFTSNVFAILGLRALYFTIAGIMKYFHYLKYGLSIILVYIGIKMIINEIQPEFINNIISLFIVITIIICSIIISIIFPNKNNKPSVLQQTNDNVNKF